MLDSIYHSTLKLLNNHIFGRENIKILPYFMQCYNGRHYVALLNLYKTTSGLSILLHDVITSRPSSHVTILLLCVCFHLSMVYGLFLWVQWVGL